MANATITASPRTRSMRLSKADLAARALRMSGGAALLRRLPAWRGLLVLNYHRIGDPDATPYDRDLFSADHHAFAEQIAHLARACDVVSPEDIGAIRRHRYGRYVLVTFDDGYRDNYELAYPVLRSYGVPATFFVCTGFIDRPHLAWWDEISWMIRTTEVSALPAGEWFPAEIPLTDNRHVAVRAALARYKELPGARTGEYLDHLRATTGRFHADRDIASLWMTWGMVREMRAGGMTIGAHTVSHQLLGRLPVVEQEREIAKSRERILAETGTSPIAFAYPVGSRTAFTSATKALLAANGFRYGFSFYGGVQPLSRADRFDPFDIRRVHVGHFIRQPVFEAMTALPTVFARW